LRIGIDVRYLSHGLVGGVHTYVRQLIPALVEISQPHSIFLYADSKCPLELTEWPEHVMVRVLPWRNAFSSVEYDFWLQRHMARDRVDIAHFPANVGFGPPTARTVITLHDAINLLPLREVIRGHPKRVSTIATMTYLHFATALAARRADLILTVSEHAAHSIAVVGGIDPDRITSIPEAPAPELVPISDHNVLEDLRSRHGLSRSFVMADALKNPGVLLQAWNLLPEALSSERDLVFFSRRATPPTPVSQAVQSGRARLLVQPTTDDLAGLYSLCDAFVFPSWMEGFGLPVLEAMRCGAPVIASDRGSLPEVVGDAGLLVDADDPRRLAQILERILGCPSEARLLQERGYQRAAQFSWEATARLTLAAYEKLAFVAA
jgi:glycosyltransferase involved in cell wall biosynthesis